MVLLITSAINVVAPLTYLNNTEDRLNQLFISVVNWFEKYQNLKIVVCDGSGYDFSDCELFQDSRFSGECLELISFNYDFELVRKYGKGNGEGQIIKYALNTSDFLSKTDFFAKVTGRLFVNNANYYFENTPENVYCQFNFNYKNIFFPIYSDAMDTRFYVIRRDFYREHLMDLYKRVDDLNGIFLEHVFFEKMNSLLSEKHELIFWCNFEVTGISGSNGLIYSEYSFLRKIINVLRTSMIRLFFKFDKLRIYKFE